MTQLTPNHDNHPDCVICKLPILPTQDDPYSQGFDAEPIAAGRCCDVCNKQVIASVKGAEKKAYLGSDPRFNKAWLEIGDYDEGERFNKNFLAFRLVDGKPQKSHIRKINFDIFCSKVVLVLPNTICFGCDIHAFKIF